MDRTAIESTVIATISSVIKRPLTEGVTATRENVAEWDSLKHIEIMFALEDAFGTEFSEEELAALDSVAKITAAAAGRHAA